MIHVRNLTYTYAGTTQPAVRDLTFTVEPGEIFGFLGPNGAGKSTTQKILTGLLKGYRGAVTVLDRDVEGWDSDYYEHVGVSFELPNHFLKLTALENLAYFSALYNRETLAPAALLTKVGLAGDADTLVSQFSKGMKNRLTVARALLHDPELLFLDEPTAGLDPVSAREMKDLIKAQQAKGKTVFLTTHDMTVADALCDRVAFIVDGQITLIGAPQALKVQHGRPSVRVAYRVNGRSEPGRATREFPLASLGENEAFFGLLRDYQVETIHTQEATLADVFIEVTGRRLR